MRYFLGLGSNIEPRRHFPRMLEALLQISPTLHIGRVVQTDPVGIVGGPFLNAAAVITTALAPDLLKASLNAVEANLGRNRADPEGWRRSRTADIDILFWLDEDAVSAPGELVVDEPYLRPVLLDLLQALGVTTQLEQPDLSPGVVLDLGGVSFGAAPLTLISAGDRLLARPLTPAGRAAAPAG